MKSLSQQTAFTGTLPTGAMVQEQKALGVELGLLAALSSHNLRG